MDANMMNELRTVSQTHVDNLMGNVLAELEKLKTDIQARDRVRPDADLLIRKAEPFLYFEFLAVACFRLRGQWKRASVALKTLEKRRGEWNTVISAALIHARRDLSEKEPGSEAYNEDLERVLKLVDILALTFRPLAGPNAEWVAVTAASVGAGAQ